MMKDSPIAPLSLWQRIWSIGGPPLIDPGEILVALLMPIGDMVLCQPAVAGLRRRYPHARLTGLVQAPRAPLAELNPDLDDLIIYDGVEEHSSLDRLDRTLAEIRQRRFDFAVSFTPAGNCVLILTGIPRQCWQRLPFGFWAWGTRDQAYRQRHAVEHYWDVIAPLGIYPTTPEDHIPHWEIPEEARDYARARLAELGIAPDEPFAAVHPGAAGHYGRKRWPPEYFATLTNRLLDDMQLPVVILGGSDDIDSADSIVRATGNRALSLAGQLNMQQTAAATSLCALYIGNDSGNTHMSASLGVPTVVIMGIASTEQFAPRSPDPSKLRIVLPPKGYKSVFNFVGTDSLWRLTPWGYPEDDRMLEILPENVLESVNSLWHNATQSRNVSLNHT